MTRFHDDVDKFSRSQKPGMSTSERLRLQFFSAINLDHDPLPAIQSVRRFRPHEKDYPRACANEEDIDVSFVYGFLRTSNRRDMRVSHEKIGSPTQ